MVKKLGTTRSNQCTGEKLRLNAVQWLMLLLIVTALGVMDLVANASSERMDKDGLTNASTVKVYGSPGDPHKLIVPVDKAPRQHELVASEGAPDLADYGPFQWLQVDQGTLDRLNDERTIQLGDAINMIWLRNGPFGTTHGAPEVSEAWPQPVVGRPRLHLLQFVDPIKDEWQTPLPASGQGFSPSNWAFVVDVVDTRSSENFRPDRMDACTSASRDTDKALDIVKDSSSGPISNGRVKPDLVVPGTRIPGAASQEAGFAGIGVCGTPSYPEGQTLYPWSSGTSYAAAAVAGGAVFVCQWFLHHPDPPYNGLPPSAAMTKVLLADAARRLMGFSGTDTLPSNSQGWGKTDWGLAFHESPRRFFDWDQVLTDTGDMFTISDVIIDPTNPFRATRTLRRRDMLPNRVMGNLMGSRVYLTHN